MKALLAKIAIGIGLTFASWFGYHQPTQSIVAGSYNPTGGGTYRLQSSISSTASSITLSSFKEPVSGIAYTMSYLNSSIEYGTIEPQSSSKEFISFTGITQNADGTATLTGVTRGLGFSYPFTASTTLQQSHSGQSIFILSNTPQVYTQQLLMANQTSTSTAILMFSSTTPPRLDSVAAQSSGTYIATTSEFATIEYVNVTGAGVNVNSTESVKGISQLATQIQMASSTSLGGTGASLVLQSKYSTSSPTSVCGLCTVITQNSGKINPNFLNGITEIYGFNAMNIGSSTVSTSTIGRLNVGSIFATSTINVSAGNNVASSSVLMNDSSGNLTFGSPQWSYVNTTDTTVSGTSASTTIFTAILPGKSLGTNGFVEFDITVGQDTIGADLSQFFELGYGNATSTVFTNWTAGAGNLTGHVRIIIAANGATNSQKVWIQKATYLAGTNTTNEMSLSQSVAPRTLTTDSTVNQPITLIYRDKSSNAFEATLVTGQLHR